MILYLLGQVAAHERRLVELEEQRGMNPTNSSLPPSSQHPHAKSADDRKKSKRSASKRKPGGQPGHKKHKRSLVPLDQVDELIPLYPSNCRGCGGQLSGCDDDPLRH